MLTVLLGAGWLAPAAAAVIDCELDGQPVNVSNGATTAGRSGLLRCVDRDSGRLQREEQYVDGRPLGYRKLIDHEGNVVIGAVNDKGNRDGPHTTTAPDGTVRAEELYRDGTRVGLSRRFDAQGRLRRITFDEPPRSSIATMAFTADGRLSELRCAAAPRLPDDLGPCGFDGEATVELFDERGTMTARVTHLNGRRIGFTTFLASGVPGTSERLEGSTLTRTVHFPDGEPRLVTVLQDGRRRSENEFARGGQRLRETLWDDAGRTGETQWYMNGSLKRREQRQGFEGAPALAVEDYWDTGQLRLRGSFDGRGRPLGMHQWFRESGTLGSERLYQKGVLVQRRDFDEQGRAVLEEEYFEDGSRKASKRR